MKKDKNCPLCNGKAFKQGDDLKILCVNHATQVISALTNATCMNIWGIKT